MAGNVTKLRNTSSTTPRTPTPLCPPYLVTDVIREQTANNGEIAQRSFLFHTEDTNLLIMGRHSVENKTQTRLLTKLYFGKPNSFSFMAMYRIVMARDFKFLNIDWD